MSETPAAIIAMGIRADDEFERQRLPKSDSAFRTISEVADQLDVPQHVLRFWETRFNQIRPLKRAGGRRYYRPEDVELLRRIRGLLYQQGYTIKGVPKLLREPGRMRDDIDIAAAAPEPQACGATAEAAERQPGDDARDAISGVIAELEAIRADLLLLKSSSTKR